VEVFRPFSFEHLRMCEISAEPIRPLLFIRNDESFTERSFQFISAESVKKLILSRFFISFTVKISSPTMFGGERYVRERIIIRNGTITSKIEHL
jgi:hypothetical protein